MLHWEKWIWPGILTVAIVSLLAIWMKRDFIQEDLTTKATTELTTNGQPWAKVEMDGRDAVLKGMAPSEEDRKQAEKITDDAYDVRVVDNQSGLVAAQSPYILTAKRDGDAVELTGFVPNEVVRGTVIDTAKELLPNSEITDSLAIARGQPESLEALVGFGLTQLAGLTQGEISLSDKSLSVKGVAKDRVSYDAINAALAGDIPSGGAITSKELTPPVVSPYVWSADYSGETLTLGGFVPSTVSRKALVAYAQSVLPNTTIEDNQLLASGGPEAFEKTAEFALKQLPRFKSGKVGLSDMNMSVSGVANSAENYPIALDAIGADALPTGVSLADGNIFPAKVSPFTWGVDYDGKTAVLTGFVPDIATRQEFVKKAKFSLGVTDITDNMQIAEGATDAFTLKADFAFQILQNLSSGKVGLSDGRLSITGVARDVASFENAKSMMNGALPSGLTLNETNVSPATVSPYRWGAKFDGNTLHFEGFVPDKATQAEILSAAATILPDANINDSVRMAAGAPTELVKAAGFSIEQLSKFSEGSVSLSDLNLSVTGVAKTVEDYQRARQAVSGELSSGMKLASQDITPPIITPYSWGADYDKNAISLTGFVPSEESRAKIISVIQTVFQSVKVVDNMQIAAGSPAAYDIATASAIAALPKFSKGSVALSGTNLTVNGTSKTSAHYLAAEQYVTNGLPEPVNLVLQKIVPPAIQGEYDWQAKKTGRHIVLSGHVPSKATRQRVADYAAKTNPDISVINRLTYGTGAPENFESNTELGLSLLTELAEGTAIISSGNLSVNGAANSVASYERLLAMMKGVEGTVQPPVISPYSWSVKNEADGVILSGFVPNKGVGNVHISASRAVLDKAVEDRQRVANGEPERFGDAAAATIAGVGQLENSQATITGTSVFLQGRAESEDDAALIADAVGKSLPENYRFRHQISFPLPEPVPEVQLKKEFVPEPIPDAPKVALKPIFVPKPVPDAPKIALKPVFVPKPVPDAPKIALKPTFVPKPISDAPKIILKTKIIAKRVDEPKPAVCTVDFMALIDGEKVQFDTAEAIISKDSYLLLDRIGNALALEECQNAHLEVGGHTDARGDETYNQELSEARAQAIVSYLMSNVGVSRDRLIPKGYGEQQPIAPDTNEERAGNRRIEFKILDQ